jgi:hypothetical protein
LNTLRCASTPSAKTWWDVISATLREMVRAVLKRKRCDQKKEAL